MVCPAQHCSVAASESAPCCVPQQLAVFRADHLHFGAGPSWTKFDPPAVRIAALPGRPFVVPMRRVDGQRRVPLEVGAGPCSLGIGGERSTREQGQLLALRTDRLTVGVHAPAACRLARCLQFFRNLLAGAEVNLVRRLTPERRVRESRRVDAEAARGKGGRLPPRC
jgi:hypothetical protein